MYTDSINNNISKCINELLENAPSHIQKMYNKIKKEVNNSQANDIIDTMIVSSLVPYILLGMQGDEMMDLIFKDNFDKTMKFVKDSKTTYTFDMVLKGQERNIKRKILIPGSTSLNDFCYIVMAAFGVQGSHLYSVEYQGLDFYCDACGDDEESIIPDIPLTMLEMKKNSKITVCYDFGDNYEFVAKVSSINKTDQFLRIEDIQLLDGQGSDIWEDEHGFLDMYYDGRLTDELLGQYGLDYTVEDMLDEQNVEFDLEEASECFYDDFVILKTIYEDSAESYN